MGNRAFGVTLLCEIVSTDPTNKSRNVPVTEQEAAAHFLRYAEKVPGRDPLYYPFAPLERYIFWMLDRVIRHAALGQARFMFSKTQLLQDR